jgi:hypothetical protein
MIGLMIGFVLCPQLATAKTNKAAYYRGLAGTYRETRPNRTTAPTYLKLDAVKHTGIISEGNYKRATGLRPPVSGRFKAVGPNPAVGIPHIHFKPGVAHQGATPTVSIVRNIKRSPWWLGGRIRRIDLASPENTQKTTSVLRRVGWFGKGLGAFQREQR